MPSLMGFLSNSNQNRNAFNIPLDHGPLSQVHTNVGLGNFNAICTLCEYPLVRNPSYSASKPAPNDVAGFKDYVRNFKPSDYEDLIEERNINGDCGYALCPNKRQLYAKAGVYKLININKANFDIMPTAELQKWCSMKCRKRAYDVLIQLRQRPTWLRNHNSAFEIELLDEEDADNAPPCRPKPADQLKADAEKKVALAVERGDNPASFVPTAFNLPIRERNSASIIQLSHQDQNVEKPATFSLPIRERNTSSVVISPNQHQDAHRDAHLMLEGYKTALGNLH